MLNFILGFLAGLIISLVLLVIEILLKIPHSGGLRAAISPTGRGSIIDRIENDVRIVAQKKSVEIIPGITPIEATRQEIIETNERKNLDTLLEDL